MGFPYTVYTPYMIVFTPYFRIYQIRGVFTVCLAGTPPNIRSYTVYIYGSGQFTHQANHSSCCLSGGPTLIKIVAPTINRQMYPPQPLALATARLQLLYYFKCSFPPQTETCTLLSLLLLLLLVCSCYTHSNGCSHQKPIYVPSSASCSCYCSSVAPTLTQWLLPPTGTPPSVPADPYGRPLAPMLGGGHNSSAYGLHKSRPAVALSTASAYSISGMAAIPSMATDLSRNASLGYAHSSSSSSSVDDARRAAAVAPAGAGSAAVPVGWPWQQQQQQLSAYQQQRQQVFWGAATHNGHGHPHGYGSAASTARVWQQQLQYHHGSVHRVHHGSVQQRREVEAMRREMER